MSNSTIAKTAFISWVLLFTSGMSSASADIMPLHCMEPGFDIEAFADFAPIDIEKLKNLRVGQKEESVRRVLGQPIYVCGSGIQHDVYVLPDKGELWLSYENGSLHWGFARNSSFEFYLGDGNTKE